MRRNRLKDVNEPQMPEGCFLFRFRRETFYPLHYAVLENDAEMVNMLLIAGSDPRQKSSKGRRPEDLARDLAADGNCETLDNLDKIIQTLQMAEASQRQQRRSVAPASQRRSVQRQQRRSVAPRVAASQRRSANSVAASLPRRSVAASQRQQRRSVAPAASQRRSANSVAASLAQRQRRRVAASQRRSATRPPERRSVAASQRHPPPGASQRNVGNPRFGPLCPVLQLIWLTPADNGHSPGFDENFS
ncbi:unnamed protein product [Cladocopium goreaui]|uniref:Uncharacterized protein n=1 Tax=Cladocopium goreaui TaxID=2562237 RepID=A0A9P1CGH1_9DINO|nr:unnamed protein product [Cladocopium goreaui]